MKRKLAIALRDICPHAEIIDDYMGRGMFGTNVETTTAVEVPNLATLIGCLIESPLVEIDSSDCYQGPMFQTVDGLSFDQIGKSTVIY